MQENNNQKGGNSGNLGAKSTSGLSWSSPASAPAPAGAAAANNNARKDTVQPVKAPIAASGSASSSAGGNKSSALKWIIGGVIVGVLLVWAWLAWSHNNNAAPASPTATSTQETEGSSSASSSNSGSTGGSAISAGDVFGLTIPSPQDAGSSVNISGISVSQPTWVVVYESRDGKPGNALGAALMFPENSSGTVQLLRATTAGHTYFVGESIDNGDHVFSLHGDQQVQDQQGNPFYTTFTVR